MECSIFEKHQPNQSREKSGHASVHDRLEQYIAMHRQSDEQQAHDDRDNDAGEYANNPRRKIGSNDIDCWRMALARSATNQRLHEQRQPK